MSTPPVRTAAVARIAATAASTVLAFVVVAYIAWSVADIILLIFAGVLVAVLLSGAAQRTSALFHIPRGWALTLVVIAMVGLLAATTYFLAPGIADQVDELQRTLPHSADRLRDQLTRYEWGRAVLRDLAPRHSSARPDVFEKVTGMLSGTLGAITSVGLVAILGLFLAVDPALYRKGMLHLVPKSHRERTEELLSKLNETLWWWLIAKFGSMTVVGILTFAGLWYLQIPLAFTLTLIAAMLTFIPNIGPVLSAVPAVLLALMQSPTTAAYTAGWYLFVQTVESYLITPIFQQRAISLPPALILTSQAILGVLAGGVGLVVATPLTAAVFVLVRELYVKSTLGDEELNS